MNRPGRRRARHVAGGTPCTPFDEPGCPHKGLKRPENGPDGISEPARKNNGHVVPSPRLHRLFDKSGATGIETVLHMRYEDMGNDVILDH